MAAHRGDAPADLLDPTVELRVSRDLFLFLDLLIRLQAELGILQLGHEDQLIAPGHGRTLAAAERGPQSQQQPAGCGAS